MPTSFVAVGCTNRHKRAGLSYHRFPKDKIRRDQWIAAVKREKWTPTEGSRLCGAHFKEGKPSSDKNHPYYIPTIFVFKKNNPEKDLKKLQRYKRAQNRQPSSQGI